MSVTFEALSGKLSLETAGWTRGLATAGQAFQGFRTQLSGAVQAFRQAGQQLAAVGAEFGKAVAATGAAATAVATATGATLVKLASDAEEAASKFGFVFSTAADDTRHSLDEFAAAAGRSKYDLRNMAADIGALIGPMGFTKKETGELSTQVAKLATDLSSFFNVSESDALTALRSGIVGESEPLRRLGVQLNEAKIQSEAFALGLASSKDEITPLIKTQAILSIVMRETAQAQGDAVRTADSYANQMRGLRGTIKDTATDIGTALLPAATATIEVFRGWISTTGGVVESIKAFIAETLSAEQVKQFWADMGSVASDLAGSFRRTWSAASELLSVFDGLGNSVSNLRQRFVEWYTELPQGTQDLLKIAGVLSGLSAGLGILGAVPFVGPLLTAVTSLLNPFKLLGMAAKSAWAILQGGWVIVGPAFVALKAAVVGLAGAIGAPVWAVVAAITAIGVAVYKAVTETEMGAAAWDGLKSVFADLGQTVWSFLTDVWQVLVEAFENNKGNLESIAHLVGIVLLGAFGALSRILTMLAKAALPVFKMAIEGVAVMLGWLGNTLGFVADLLTGNWTAALNRVLELLLAFVETVEGVNITILQAFGIEAPAALTALSAKLRSMIAENQAAIDQQQRAAEAAQVATAQKAAAEERAHGGFMAAMTERFESMTKEGSLAGEISDQVVAAEEKKQAAIRGTSDAQKAAKASSERQLADAQRRLDRSREVAEQQRGLIRRPPRAASAPPGEPDFAGHPDAQGRRPKEKDAPPPKTGLALAMDGIGRDVNDLASARGGEAQKMLAGFHSQFNDAIKGAVGEGATNAQRKQLVALKREIIAGMQVAANSTGEMKQAAMARLAELSAAWLATFQTIGKKSKAEVAAVRERVGKELGEMKKAVGDMGQAVAAVGGAGRGSRNSGGGNLLGGLFNAAPIRQFTNALRGAQNAFGGIVAGGKNFAAAVAAQVDPVAKINLQIAKLRGELSGMEYNASKWASGPSTIAAMESHRRQIGALEAEKGRIEAERRAAALAFYRRRQASLRQSEARRAEEGVLVENVATKTGGRALGGSRFDFGAPAGLETKGVTNVSPTANVVNNFNGVLTPGLAKQIAQTVDTEFNRMGRDVWGRSIARSR